MKLNLMSTEELALYLENSQPYDIAKELEKLNENDQLKVFDLLDDEKQAEVLAYLKTDDAVHIFNKLEDNEQVDLLDNMEPDDAIDIIQELDDNRQEALIELLDDPNEIRELIKYEDDQAGAYMTPDIVKIEITQNIQKAIKQMIKEASDVESINSLFIVDENDLYLGTVDFKALIRASSESSLENLLVKAPACIDTDKIELVSNMVHEYGIYEVGIIDKNNKLLGMITIDDAIDIYDKEANEDYEKLAALPSTKEDSKVLKQAIRRLPWLLVLLTLSIPIALVTHMFEEILAAVVILALFQPLILDSGGDVATQTLAVTLISLNDNTSKPLKNGINEIITGLINGLILGVLAFGATYLMGVIIQANHLIELSFVVSLALFLTVLLGPVIGFIVPITLKKCKADPAIASGPFITTLIDIISLAIFFGLATIILGGVIR